MAQLIFLCAGDEEVRGRIELSGIGWNKIGWDGIGWNEIGWDGIGWNEIG
jgi:hypothetical protein